MSWLRRGVFCCLLLLAAAPFWAAWAEPSSTSPSSISDKGQDVQDVQRLQDVREERDLPASDSRGVECVERRLSQDLPDEFVVRVTGRDFRWHFEVLDDHDDQDGQVEPASHSRLGASILELPTGVPIRWEVTSDDFIYWLRVPELGVNVMAVPDLTFEAASEPTEPVGIDLLVDPLCGFRFYHDEWMGRIELHPHEHARPAPTMGHR